MSVGTIDRPAIAMRRSPDHGTGARYARGCRCRPCTNKAVRDDQLRILDRLQGRPRTVPGAPVVAHLGELRANDMSWDEIGRAAGISASTPREIYAEQRATVLRGTAEKILSVPVTHQATEIGFVNALGATRRIRALYAIGRARGELAARSGLSEYAITLIADGKWTVIRLCHDQAIRRMYRDMSMQPGRSAKNRIRARREGWGSPMAWDDIDDPAAEPVHQAVGARERLTLDDYRNRRDGRVRQAKEWREQGRACEEIGPLLGVSGRTVFRWQQAGWPGAA